MPRVYTRRDPAARFWQYVRALPVADPDACWLWRGATSPNGYGTFSLPGRKGIPVHRFAYEMMVGPIAEGLTIDHLCRVTNCVNPAHMEPVTAAENMRRGRASNPNRKPREPWKTRWTHCKQGHPFTPENTSTDKHGWRRCRTCRRNNRKD